MRETLLQIRSILIEIRNLMIEESDTTWLGSIDGLGNLVDDYLRQDPIDPRAIVALSRAWGHMHGPGGYEFFIYRDSWEERIKANGKLSTLHSKLDSLLKISSSTD